MHTRIAPHLSAAFVGSLAGVLLFCSTTVGAADCNGITITNQPQSLYVLEGCPATFAVGVTGTSPHRYQWWWDGQAIPDAANSSYTIAVARPSDNGARIHVTITNNCSQVISAEAFLFIAGDPVRPALGRARGDATLEEVLVSFSVGACGWPGLDPGTSQVPWNYSLTGGLSVSNAVLDATGTNVLLTTSRQAPGTIYTLSVEYISDRMGNLIQPDAMTRFQAWVFLPGSDPPTVVPPPVNITRSGGTNYITWPPGSLLQDADRITGPWNTLSPDVSPYQAAFTNAARFFRALF
jgi:hypothetical protein